MWTGRNLGCYRSGVALVSQVADAGSRLRPEAGRVNAFTSRRFVQARRSAMQALALVCREGRRCPTIPR